MAGTDEGSSTLLQPEITTEVWDDLFATSSDEDNPKISETVELSITQAHRDPLEECMDGVEAFVHSVLKTGKITVAGEAGGKYGACVLTFHILRERIKLIFKIKK